MATFKIGQRVRVVAQEDGARSFVGKEGHVTSGLKWHKTLRGRQGPHYQVRLDNAPEGLGDHIYIFMAHELAPLTDPKADEFIARLERLGREPVGKPIVETVGVSK